MDRFHSCLRRAFPLAAITLALFGAVSCSDTITPPEQRLPDAAHFLEAANTETQLPQFDHTPRFEFEIQARGSLKPGHPIRLVLTGRANRATRDAEIRLTLPEVAAAEDSGWDEVVTPVGEESRPHIRFRRGLEAGERFREETSLVIPEPGYYYVVATGVQHSDDADTDGVLAQQMAAQALWLWISEDGGRITADFDTTVFSPDDRRERGPRTPANRPARVRGRNSPLTCTVTGPDDPVLMSVCPGSGWTPPEPEPWATASFIFTYDNEDTGHAYAAVQAAYVTWKITSSSGTQISQGAAYTNASGAIPQIDCKGPSSDRRIDVRLHTINTLARVHYLGKEEAGSYVGICGGGNEVRARKHMAHLFSNLQHTAEGHKQVFGSYPNRITAGLYDDGQTFYAYNVAGGELHIANVSHMVFREYGVMVAAHEHGHLWQDKVLWISPAQNGLMRMFTQVCPRQHLEENATTLACAWAEGFADWYAVAVREAAMPLYRERFEDNYFHLTCRAGQRNGLDIKCSDDGSIVQGAIHAFLWDLYDPSHTGEDHDRLKIEAWRIAEAIKTCLVKPADHHSYIPYNGVDHLIFCMGGQAPYRMRIGLEVQTFFNTRPQSKWAERASGAQISAGYYFNNLWMVNLYSKRVGMNPALDLGGGEPGTEVPPSGGTCLQEPCPA